MYTEVSVHTKVTPVLQYRLSMILKETYRTYCLNKIKKGNMIKRKMHPKRITELF